MADELSEQVIEFVKTFTAERGFAPTVREIAIGLNAAPATIHRRIQLLQEDGRVSSEPLSPRTLQVLDG